VDEHGGDADGLRSERDAAQRVGEEIGAELPARVIAIDGEPADDGYGNRVRRVAADFSGRCCAQATSPALRYNPDWMALSSR